MTFAPIRPVYRKIYHWFVMIIEEILFSLTVRDDEGSISWAFPTLGPTSRIFRTFLQYWRVLIWWFRWLWQCTCNPGHQILWVWECSYDRRRHGHRHDQLWMKVEWGYGMLPWTKSFTIILVMTWRVSYRVSDLAKYSHRAFQQRPATLYLRASSLGVPNTDEIMSNPSAWQL